MIGPILLAVDDTPDSLAAARLAIQIAAGLPAELRVVHVRANPAVDTALERLSSTPHAGTRRGQADVAVLTRVATLARDAGVVVTHELLTGAVAPAILDAARECGAGLVVLGKSARSASGEPYVGSQTRHVLEFSDQPVLVVPPAQPRTAMKTR